MLLQERAQDDGKTRVSILDASHSRPLKPWEIIQRALILGVAVHYSEHGCRQRERAEPSMLVMGSDTHTCSSGAVSCLTIGLGAGDFKVSEAIRIDFVDKPSWYICGKDEVLSLLNQRKRNTSATNQFI
ncbi:aconitase family [Pyrenophora seminiperda CCB06]|uniref:Aconitase family n=1 Tax=Pyrenophora seminiperda CCB06 TaxID=1302712 RepID=A0A3M7MEL4_9PLEO|nr:aconitase family [Pyrenophora seminiperda CCB06]